MDADLIEALEGIAPTEVLLVTIVLPDDTIRWTDGGFVVWDSNTYQDEDATWGALSAVEEIEDGVTGSATVCALSINAPPDSLADWTAVDVQGSVVTVHLGAVDRATGLLIGEPELLIRCELDQPRLGVGGSVSLIYDCITEEARMLEPNEEQRQTDSFHQTVWPGEKHYEFVTDVRRKIYWRADNPNNAVS